MPPPISRTMTEMAIASTASARPRSPVRPICRSATMPKTMPSTPPKTLSTIATTAKRFRGRPGSFMARDPNRRIDELGARADNVAIPVKRRPWCARQRGEVDVDQTEALGEPLSPLEVVHQRPHEVAPHRCATAGRLGDRPDVTVEVCDAVTVHDG